MKQNLLRDPKFLLYLFISFFTRAGDTIFKIALILFIINKGGSAGTVGILIILTVLPSVLFGPISGIFSDRFNLKFILHSANLIRTIVLLITPFIENINILYISGFILSVATLFAVPSQKVILPLIIKDEDIPVGAGYLASTRSIIDTLIPIFGSGLAMLIGFIPTFYLNALFYILGSILLIFLKIDKRENFQSTKNTRQKNVFGEIIDGFKYLFLNKKLKIITIAAVFTLGLSAGLEILIPIHILFDLKYSETTYGLLMGMIGLGLVVGGIIIPKIQSKFNLSILFIFAFSIALDGLSFLFFNLLSSSLISILLIMFISGISSAGFLIMVDSYMQTEVEKSYLGRTYSSYISLANIFSVIVMGIVSLSADTVGTSMIFFICSIGIFLTGILTLYLGIFKDNNLKTKQLDI
ncbi:MFS transporter (plasmid) [Bacillus mycoides]|uniref:MFS transporter n=1 Tax=Bacillus mycoides TaxID=1405 RepID=UPI003F74B47B